MPSLTERFAFPGCWSRVHVCSGLALGVLTLLVCAQARAEWDIEATAGASYDDNLTRANNSVDKRAAGAAMASVSGIYFVPLTGSDGMTFRLNGRGEVYARYSGLTNLVVGAAATYRHKFGLGATAPWASFSVGTSYDDYRDDLRTSTRLDVRAEAGKRFTEQFDASAGVYWERRYDNNGESVVPGISGTVFNLAGQGAYLRAGYAPTNELLFDLKAAVRRGDVESTTQRSFQIFRASSAITTDPVWGDPNLIAYRLRGTTYTGALTASYALSDRSSLEAAYRYDFTNASQGLEYTTNLIVLTFVYRH